MFLLTRSAYPGHVVNLAVFKTELAARKYRAACKACHAKGAYEYKITQVAFDPMKMESI